FGVHEFFVGTWLVIANEMRIQSVTMKRSHHPSTRTFARLQPGAPEHEVRERCPESKPPTPSAPILMALCQHKSLKRGAKSSLVGKAAALTGANEQPKRRANRSCRRESRPRLTMRPQNPTQAHVHRL